MEYFAFQWHITEACDQRCKHCYIYALGSHAKFQAMALEDMIRAIENCQAFCRKAGRLPYFYLTGGDPWTASEKPTTASAAPAPTTRPWRPSPCCGRRASTWP